MSFQSLQEDSKRSVCKRNSAFNRVSNPYRKILSDFIEYVRHLSHLGFQSLQEDSKRNAPPQNCHL